MNRFKHNFSSIFLALTLFLASIFTFISTTPASAIPFFDGDGESTSEITTESPDDNEDSENPTNSDNENAENTEETDSEEEESICAKQSGPLYWIVCPATNFLGSLIDNATSVLHEFFEINAISTEDSSPVYLIWQYMRNLTNIVFIIFILIVIYSQLTGIGINNYGIKRVLPRIIIAVILVNLSFIICSLVIDVSNIIGNSIIGFCQNIQDQFFSQAESEYSWGALVTTFVSVGTGVGLAAIINFSGGFMQYFFMLLPILISGTISVVIGLITIAARQALVALLVMIAPLAFVAYLLPNTEKWFSKWRELLARMLVFYPMFSFLVGASQLLGNALIVAATSPFGLLIGYAVKVVPIFFAFSLMKMSGTVLGSLNAGLARLASPINNTASGWANSHAERRRQNTILHSKAPSARLRRFLDYKKAVRENDTENATKARQGMATDRALTKISGFLGYDEKTGHAKFKRRASRYTENAKLASYYDTRASTAKDVLDNTISEYGDHFGGKFDKKGQDANRLNARHARAFENAMAQKFLAANIAQGDQDYLLGKYLEASTTRDTDPKAYNRLIKSAASSLGHIGEGSIMGQVISENARIEQRRRSEARIIANKFGIKKSDFRGMAFDCKYIDDEGYETDEKGNKLHDAQMKYFADKKYGSDSAAHQQWDQFIAVHKDTRKEITAEQYNKLSDADKANYKRVNYMNITNDQGKIVQQVFADDAGYMKELIRDDIAIGDPINRRYMVSIGKKLTDDEIKTLEQKYHVKIPKDSPVFKNEDGILRRYHSSVYTSLLETGYKEHDAAYTAMLGAQINNGSILSMGQYNIANIESVVKAAKAGPILQNDSFAIKTWNSYIKSLYSDKEGERFEDLFPDDCLAMYGNVNAVPLHGYRKQLDANGNFLKWEKVDRTNETITLEERKNFIKHKLFTDLGKKLVSSMNRRISPQILDSQKPETLAAFIDLINTLKEAAFRNLDPNIPVEEKLDPAANILNSPNPEILQMNIQNIQAAAQRVLNGEDLNQAQEELQEIQDQIANGTYRYSKKKGNSKNTGGSNFSSGSSNSGSSPRSTSHQQSHSRSNQSTNAAQKGVDLFSDAINRVNESDERDASYNDPETIIEMIDNICDSRFVASFELAAKSLTDYFVSNKTLAPHIAELYDIIETCRQGKTPDNTMEAINMMTDLDGDSTRIANLHRAALELARFALYGV